MLITKFNKLIRSKLIWSGIAIVISISFLGFMGPKSGCDKDQQVNRNSAGSLFGEDVSRQEYVQARFFELGMSERRSLTPEESEILRTMTWQRIAALRKASALGLTVTDSELLETIQQDPSFSASGVFSHQQYRTIIEQQLRIPVEMFEEYMRQRMLLGKLAETFELATWASPIEVTQRLRALTDSFVVELAIVEREPRVKKARATDEAVVAFFEENAELFRVPEQRVVDFVRFPISDYLARADESTTELDLIEYYDEHQDDYMDVTTNGLTEFIPFEQVKTNIQELVRFENARNLARDEATVFAVKLTPYRGNTPATFEALAAKQNRPIETSAPFSAADIPEGMEVDSSFARAAFRLEPRDTTDAVYFSDPVTGKESVFVLALKEQIESRIPALDDVRDDVELIVLQRAQDTMFTEAIDSIHDDVSAALDNGKSFAEALAKHDLKPVTTPAFDVYTGITNDVDYAEILPPTIMQLQQGDVSEPVPYGEQALIAFVQKREPGDFMLEQFLRPQVLPAIDRYRASLLYNNWLESILTEANLDDYLAPPAIADTATDDAATEDDQEPAG